MADIVQVYSGPPIITEVVEGETLVVEVVTSGPQGVAGPAGPQGLPGAGGVAAIVVYRHVQNAPSTTWSIQHNLNLRPNVTVVDTSGTQVEGDVVYTNDNLITVSFTFAFAGEAYLS